VKYRIRSSLPMSGNERSCSGCSAENILAATATTPTHARAKPYEP
jgi:hypothetical protein